MKCIEKNEQIQSKDILSKLHEKFGKIHADSMD